KIPLGVFTAFTGVSGSGKSSLVEDILYNQLAKTLHRASTVPGAHESIRGIEQINKVIRVDQQPLGNTPTSNPATYTGVFDLIRNIPKIRRILQTLCDVGLDYLTLGQSAPTLSGGEAQRVKLAAELARPDTGQTLYLLDEPTTGLHFDDLAKLLEVLNRLVD